MNKWKEEPIIGSKEVGCSTCARRTVCDKLHAMLLGTLRFQKILAGQPVMIYTGENLPVGVFCTEWICED